MAKLKLAKWHRLNEKKIKKFRLIKLDTVEKKQFLDNLYTIGYNKVKKVKLNYNSKILATAFQRRYRQDLINGKFDQECLMISKSLIK